MSNKHDKPYKTPDGANIAGVPIEEPNAGVAIPSSDGAEPYIPRHLAPDDAPHRREGSHAAEPTGGADYIPQPDGTNIAPNGAVIRNPWSEKPEIKPDYEYTDEQQDYDLLIM